MFFSKAKQREAEEIDIGNRDRMALLLLREMQQWEASDPTHVGVYQCLDRGVLWVSERARVPPAVATLIVKSAYRQIIKDKLEKKLETP
jgi:hypothetical protein